MQEMYLKLEICTDRMDAKGYLPMLSWVKKAVEDMKDDHQRQDEKRRILTEETGRFANALFEALKIDAEEANEELKAGRIDESFEITGHPQLIRIGLRTAYEPIITIAVNTQHVTVTHKNTSSFQGKPSDSTDPFESGLDDRDQFFVKNRQGKHLSANALSEHILKPIFLKLMG